MKLENSPSIELSADQFGPAGVKEELHILAIMENEKRIDTDRLNDQTKRTFKVFGQLAKNPPAAENIKGDFSAKDGGSYLVMPDTAVMSRIRCAEGMFEIKKNAEGEKSLIEFECDAKNTTEAKQKFRAAVLPFLDYLSYISNCPIIIGMIRVEDTKNDRISIEYVSPYRKTVVNPHNANLYTELAPVYAMYREAKNSHSDFYKFLCYYKILEGLLGKLRANLFSKARNEKIDLTRPKEIVPSSTEIFETYKIHIGTPLRSFFDNVLTPKFRNAVAHFNTDDGAVLNTSSPEHIASYGEVLYILELCVRTAISSHEYLLNEFHSSNKL
jgi:hypothetical protein